MIPYKTSVYAKPSSERLRATQLRFCPVMERLIRLQELHAEEPRERFVLLRGLFRQGGRYKVKTALVAVLPSSISLKVLSESLPNKVSQRIVKKLCFETE